MRGVSLDQHGVYVRPRPEVVAEVWDWSSPEAACERWFWVPRSHLAKIATEGRHLIARRAGIPVRTSAARSTTPEQDIEVIEAVRRIGSIWRAAQETGLKLGVVRRILREREEPIPTTDRTQSAQRAAETKRRRAA